MKCGFLCRRLLSILRSYISRDLSVLPAFIGRKFLPSRAYPSFFSSSYLTPDEMEGNASGVIYLENPPRDFEPPVFIHSVNIFFPKTLERKKTLQY